MYLVDIIRIKALSTILCWNECPNDDRFGACLLDISFLIPTQT